MNIKAWVWSSKPDFWALVCSSSVEGQYIIVFRNNIRNKKSKLGGVREIVQIYGYKPKFGHWHHLPPRESPAIALEVPKYHKDGTWWSPESQNSSNIAFSGLDLGIELSVWLFKNCLWVNSGSLDYCLGELSNAPPRVLFLSLPYSCWGWVQPHLFLDFVGHIYKPWFPLSFVLTVLWVSSRSFVERLCPKGCILEFTFQNKLNTNYPYPKLNEADWFLNDSLISLYFQALTITFGEPLSLVCQR